MTSGGHQQGQCLALAAGEQADGLLHSVLQPHVELGKLGAEEFLVRLGHPAQKCVPVGGGVEVGHGQIFLNGHVWRGAPHGILKQVADVAGAPVFGQEGDVLTVQFNLAFIHIEIRRRLR